MKKLILVIVCALIFSCKKNVKNTALNGSVFGTSYSIIYDSEINYQKQFDSLFYVINKSMSTYQTNSIISKINRDETVDMDVHFDNVFKASKKIFYDTEGAFDPTIGAVVNAWDFGPEGKILNLDSLKIDSLMTSVGFNKILRIDNHLTKPKDAFIDFNAIAKGYGVDVIGEFMESQNIKNYLVEIGGEIRVKGINAEKQTNWIVGVENPDFNGDQSILKAITLQDEAMATSGTYRKFKLDENGNRYAHIIDTKTGYPSKTNLLSVSVIAKSCMIADAYATAFKAMGIEKVKEFLERHPELKVFLIFENDNGEFETLSFNGFPE
ncbi:FAD:protein FMN transferase [Flaviramulus sp. BrNp1-15]|uniref:FAD:protein FMN transferase n=1 Tax=Flaviramulus sp. BrNp1-15 TaxID=2916754 RepID=UPI001EE8CE33|nr:FAD:protein FMN transferase [Flaviramulus sp. BrNp1-15]ULC60460.1 FAD:protein FMN transferase [Flaviramulus sp. BrNp1-15]